MLGKKVLNHSYWHCSLSNAQDDVVRERIALAESLAHVKADQDYNVVKYPSGGNYLSLLAYADFFDAPFPALAVSYRVDFTTGRVEKRNYQHSSNPPILHRKELLLSADHPRQAEFRELTQTAEQLGLFDNPVTIGFQNHWETLIAASGFQLLDGQFVALGNQEDDAAAVKTETATVARHLTALSRNNVSAPMQCLARHGYLDGTMSVFDYGCGRGDDIRNLTANQITVSGWDPHYAPQNPKHPADIVNLGFVINVIEDVQERIEALAGAYQLAERLLVVSAMLVNQNAFKGLAFNDGVLTQRGTFQKYFSQTELKGFLEDVLDKEAIPVAPGIFYVFKDTDAEQRFLLGRQRSTRNYLRLSARPIQPKGQKITRATERNQRHQTLIEPLWQQALMLGRFPEKNEIANPLALTEGFGSVTKALRYLQEHTDPTQLEQAQQNRISDLLTYFALQTFSRRKPYKHLDNSIQNDIKAFFGDYPGAISQAQTELFQLGKPERIAAACGHAAEQGLGYLDNEAALHVHSSQVNGLPLPLRIYVGCATVLYGDIEQADLIKIHSQSGKLSLMRYDDFIGQPLPRLLERVKINLREQTFDLYQYPLGHKYGEDYEPTNLYLKSRFINEEFPDYAEQAHFDEQLQALALFDLSGYGPKPNDFLETLANARWAIDGFQLVRSQTIPDIDSLCGRYLSYRHILECGETQHATGLPNLPKQPDSYTALYELATHILDPIIDYFGMIRLTYGFCSHELGKHIKHRVAPKLDQHAAHERNSKGNLICPRLGAAVDFIVEDENMREVADWIAANTPFDRLYFYGENRPVHVSFGPELKGDYIEVVIVENGKQIPRKRFSTTMYKR